MKSADEPARSLGTVNPDVIRNYRFSTAFRGYDTAEVRAFLNSVADAVATYSENASAYVLSVAESVNPAAVAGNTAPAPADELTAEDVAAAIEKARADAESIVAAAKDEANAIVTRANDEAARIFLRARAESRGKPSADTMAAMELALADAPSDPNVAKEQARIMISEAKAVRERILTDLAKRRRVAHVQLEQLRVAREKLLESFRDARRVADEASRDLSTAEVEARLAAETAGRRVGAEDLPSVAELEAELFSGRSILSSGSNLATGNRSSAATTASAPGFTNQPFDLEAEVDARSVTQEPDGTDVVHAASPGPDDLADGRTRTDDLDTGVLDTGVLVSASPVIESAMVNDLHEDQNVPGEFADDPAAVAESERETVAIAAPDIADAATPAFVDDGFSVEDVVTVEHLTVDNSAGDDSAVGLVTSDLVTSDLVTSEEVTSDQESVDAARADDVVGAVFVAVTDPFDDQMVDAALTEDARADEATADDVATAGEVATNVVQFSDYATMPRASSQAQSHPAVQSVPSHGSDIPIEAGVVEQSRKPADPDALVVVETEEVTTESSSTETLVDTALLADTETVVDADVETLADTATPADTEAVVAESDPETGTDPGVSASLAEGIESSRVHSQPTAGRLANVDDLFARLRRERESAAASAHELLDGNLPKGGTVKPSGPSSGKGKKNTPKLSGTVLDRTLIGTEQQQAGPRESSAENHESHDAPTASGPDTSASALLFVDLTEFESEVLTDSRFDPNLPGMLSDDLFPSSKQAPAAATSNPDTSAEFEFVTGTLQAQCTRAMKRFLQDEQSRALAALRTARGRVTLEDLLGDAEAREQRLGDTVQPYLTDACRAGADLSLHSAEEESMVAELKNLEIALVSTVTGTTRTALDQAMSSDLSALGQTLSDAIAEVYRGWPSERLSSMVAEHLRAAFQLGHGLVR